MLNLTEHWIFEKVINVGDPKSEMVKTWLNILYEPEHLRMESDNRRRIKPSVPGEQGSLNIKRSKPAIKVTPEMLAKLSGGGAALSQSESEPKKGLSLRQTPDGELEVDA